MRIRFPSWTVVVALLVVCVAGFGLLIPKLGFYMDDWRPVFAAFAQGPAGLWKFFAFDDRPLAAWLYVSLAPVLGITPITWQIFELACRWLTALALWQVMRLVWPRHTQEVSMAALLFAVYPTFKQMPIAVTFSQQWAAFLAYSISLLAMLYSVRSRRWYIPLTLLGMITAFLHLVTLEYFVGLELLRPVLLWLAVAPRAADLRKRALDTLKYWLPYLLVELGFVVWRLFLIQLPNQDRNTPGLLYGLFHHPFYYIDLLAQNVLQDLSNIFFTTWYNTVQPGVIQLQKSPALKINLVFWAVVLVIGVLAAVYLLHLERREEGEQEPAGWRSWWAQALIAGGLGVLLGHAPAWALGRQAAQANTLWADRFALPAMFGASLFLVALFVAVLKNRTTVIIAVSILVGLACGADLRNGYDYVKATESQTPFYWQLVWRAPNLAPGTALMSNHELFSKMGVYPTSMAINLLYPQSRAALDTEADKYSRVSYWFYSVEKYFYQTEDDLARFIQGEPIHYQTASFEFYSTSQNSLVIQYDTQNGQCLWVLNPADTNNPLVADVTRRITKISNLSLISTAANPGYPPAGIFGKEPKHTWCYYYEKAELARQQGDWSAVMSLWDQAAQKGYKTKNGYEMTTFILGMAHTGRWDQAVQLTDKAWPSAPAMKPYLCSLWLRIQGEIPSSPAQAAAISAARNELACGQ